MAKFQAAYWGESGIEVYELGNGHAHRLFSGPIDACEQIRGWPKRRILIIGRSNFIRVRKRYPPAKIDTLRRAVAMEAADLFPIPNPVVHCRIRESYATHVTLDIWAWGQESVDQLRKAFPFGHTVPEDLAFLYRPPMIHVYPVGSMIHVVACGGGRFFDALSCRGADFSAEVMKKFRTGLAGNTSVVSGTRFYGDIPGGTGSAAPLLTKVSGTGHPPCLDALAEPAFKFRQFRSSGGDLPVLNRPVLFRCAVYAVAAYGVSLFLTLQNYDQALKDSLVFSKTLDREIALLERDDRGNQGEPEVYKKFREIITGDLPPLRVLDVLAADLPEGSHVKSVSLHDGVVEAVVLSRDPLTVIKRLDGSDHFRKLSLKGSPTSDATGVYSCTLQLEMKP